MATNNITISSFQWGLANDKNSWQKGAFWDAQGIEIRKNSEYVTLNRGVTESFSTGTSPIVALALTNYSGSGTLANEINAFCSDWKIYEALTGEINKLTTVTAGVNQVDDSCANIIYVPAQSTTPWYNYILWNNYLWRFQNGTRENVLATNTFSSWWTGTNWSLWVHTAGSTVAYTQSSPIVTVSWERYHIIVDVTSQSVWTCTVSIWWQTSGNLSVWRNDIYITTSSTDGVSFNPSSSSTIVLSYVRVDRVSDLASSNGLWIKKIWSLTSWQTRRPAINFYWDLLIWDGNQIARYNKDGTIMLFSTSIENPVIGWLDWIVYAITQIGANIYVWCNNWWSTNVYIWDWLSSRPSQKMPTQIDKPVINVALLNNQHYWWSEKWPMSQKHIMIWEGYQVQRYITSDIPKALWTETLDDPDRLALYWTNTNAIETFWDIVYLPWYGKIYWFGSYFPWQPIALNKEFTFNWTECTSMLTTTVPTLWQDFTFYMVISYIRSGSYYVWIIDFRDYNGTYVSDWYLETMEYLWVNLWIEKNQKKLLVPFYLPDNSTSIEVYERKNQESSYSLIKTIDSTTYPALWFWVAEIWDQWKWNTIQWKFKLITSDTTYSPRLYVWITDILTDTANRNG